MKGRRGTPALTCLLTALIIYGTGCIHRQTDTSVEKHPLPPVPPLLHTLILSDSADQFPRWPSRERAPFNTPSVTKIRQAALAAQEKRIREAAEMHPLVIKELSERYAHFHTDVFEVGSGFCPLQQNLADEMLTPTAPPPITRLTYFSYTRNSTVVVCMRGERFLSVGRQEGYQPPERKDEIDAAIALAKRDPHLDAKLDGLTGRAILIEPETGILFQEPGAGNRVFWVTFSTEAERHPHYWAIVDLSEGKVIRTGQEVEQ